MTNPTMALYESLAEALATEQPEDIEALTYGYLLHHCKARNSTCVYIRIDNNNNNNDDNNDNNNNNNNNNNRTKGKPL